MLKRVMVLRPGYAGYLLNIVYLKRELYERLGGGLQILKLPYGLPRSRLVLPEILFRYLFLEELYLVQFFIDVKDNL